jgi:hypothetical protein
MTRNNKAVGCGDSQAACKATSERHDNSVIAWSEPPAWEPPPLEAYENDPGVADFSAALCRLPDEAVSKSHLDTFLNRPEKTDKTGETDSVGNDEFLRAVFGDDLADNRPVVVSFNGNPVNAPSKVWFGRPWQGNTELPTSLPAHANNYFSLATFGPDEAGQYRRQKARFQALQAVMLDDVGTKVARERLTLPPSWLGAPFPAARVDARGVA